MGCPYKLKVRAHDGRKTQRDPGNESQSRRTATHLEENRVLLLKLQGDSKHTSLFHSFRLRLRIGGEQEASGRVFARRDLCRSVGRARGELDHEPSALRPHEPADLFLLDGHGGHAHHRLLRVLLPGQQLQPLQVGGGCRCGGGGGRSATGERAPLRATDGRLCQE